MLKIYRYNLKSKTTKAIYKTFVISFWIFKFERIGYKHKFLWRFELSNWKE